MPRPKKTDPKQARLREQGSLNPHPERVTDPLFGVGEFFDRRDLVQVKYEMLRGAKVEAKPASHCAAAFGLSRPTFYEAQAAFNRAGLLGLIPRKRGPRGGHKLTEEILGFVEQLIAKDGPLSPAELVSRIGEKFGLKVHPRSLQRALRRREKKRK